MVTGITPCCQYPKEIDFPAGEGYPAASPEGKPAEGEPPMSTAADKDKAKRGIKARQDALKTLIGNHREEFEALVERNRLSLGLSRRPQGASDEVLEARIKRAREQMEKWERELAERA
jgi:hypothetical protein